MLRRVLNLVFFVLVTGLLWYLNRTYPSDPMQKWYHTVLWLSIIYLVFKVALEELVSRTISDVKARYAFRKTVSVLNWVVFTVIVMRIWVINPEALLVAYGLIGAGVAVSLQDFFKNFVGGLTLLTRGIYRVGDRIEINGEYGDIIDIGIMYTTVMEMREWVDGDQATGRICTIPNGFILSYVLNNYTRDHTFIWDEIKIPITYDSDWQEAHDMMLKIVKKETKETAKKAEKEISKIRKRFLLQEREVEPSIFMTMTDNWINFNVRYVTDVKERRALHNKISQKILKDIEKSRKVKIASATLDIIGFPGKKKK